MAWVASMSLCGFAAAEPRLPATAPDRGAHRHDGFYLRAASGFGAYDERANSQTADVYQGRLRIRSRGFAVASEFAMGGTPFEGLVIGGGVYSMTVYTSSVTFNKETAPAEDVGVESRDFSVVGVFVDRYFVPTLGVHVQGALGIAQQLGLTVNSDPFDSDDYNPVGPGIMLGLGYEMWIAEQWSLGVLARFGGSVLFGKDTANVRWVHYIITNPTFLMTVTYH